MKPRLLLFVWLLFLPIGSGNETKATLQVVVKDELGAVIPRAKLLVRWDPASLQVEASRGENPDTTSQADERGQMAIALNPGFYDVLVTSSSFTPSCKKVRIKTGTTVSMEFKLKADPLVTAELGHEIYSN
jgi:hypothetical protein